MGKHTPRQWSIQRHDTGDSRRIVIVGKSGMVADVDWSSPPENESNARLIAAAPELLAALKSLVNMQKGREEWPEVLAAESAIAKAEGGGT